jgi:hypothetical protein
MVGFVKNYDVRLFVFVHAANERLNGYNLYLMIGRWIAGGDNTVGDTVCCQGLTGLADEFFAVDKYKSGRTDSGCILSYIAKTYSFACSSRCHGHDAGITFGYFVAYFVDETLLVGSEND